jgi:hypothetical protein
MIPGILSLSRLTLVGFSVNYIYMLYVLGAVM